MRAVTILIVLAVAAIGCGSVTPEVRSADARPSSSVTSDADGVVTTTGAEPTDSSVATTTSVSQLEQAVSLPSGRDAVAAAQGQPHVLWFWGAH